MFENFQRIYSRLAAFDDAIMEEALAQEHNVLV